MTPTAIRLSIEGASEKPVLVIANSLAATSAMWDTQCEEWRQHWRLARFEYAGHNAPDFAGPAEDTIESIGASLLSLLDESGSDKFSFIGLSLGGMLGLQLAAMAPDRVVRLVVANCRFYQTAPLQQQWDERIAAVQKGGMEAIADATVERWLSADFSARNSGQAKDVRAMICRTSRQGYAAAATAVRNFDARSYLRLIACPVLVISGAQDGAAPTAHLAELTSELGAQLLELDPCAHLSSVECADTFTTETSNFLQ